MREDDVAAIPVDLPAARHEQITGETEGWRARAAERQDRVPGGEVDGPAVGAVVGPEYAVVASVAERVAPRSIAGPKSQRGRVRARIEIRHGQIANKLRREVAGRVREHASRDRADVRIGERECRRVAGRQRSERSINRIVDVPRADDEVAADGRLQKRGGQVGGDQRVYRRDARVGDARYGAAVGLIPDD